MEKKAFEKLVAEAFDSIPEKFRKKIKNVALTIEDEPSARDLKERHMKPGQLLLGLYVGIPATSRGVDFGSGAVLPDVIKIFQKPIEELAGNNEKRIKEIVQDTVFHEYAHYFGMSEHMVRQWEKRRGK